MCKSSEDKVLRMNIGNRIEAVRGHLSRREFARLIDVVESTLRNYENGLSLPNSSTISKICAIMGVSMEWLVNGTGPMRAGETPPPPAGEDDKDARIRELEAELAREKEAKEAWKYAAKAYELATMNIRNGLDTPQVPLPQGGDCKDIVKPFPLSGKSAPAKQEPPEGGEDE